jgi:hypothetical protein
MPQDDQANEANSAVSSPAPAPLTRRTVIASAAIVPLTALTHPSEADAQSKKATQAGIAAPKPALTAAQRRTLEAMVDRLVPQDELGPGALDMGAAEYIDRSLADAISNEKTAFTNGLSSIDSFARASHGAAFAELTSEKKDAVLTAMEAGNAGGFPDAQGFFNRVRRLTLEGMFSDPYYGGNKNFAGWDLIRYPGIKLATSIDDQKMSKAPTPVRKSIYDTGGNHGH